MAKENPKNETFGQTLARLRADADMTVEQASASSNIEFSLWKDFESGVRTPSIIGLWEISNGLGINPREFFK